ncbi:MAG: 5'-nucleotidase (lipoprotein e(P4) family) [Planctomycetota bacterium]|jgi:5'-nucleotidase (lipoprotein e(P4) family)
MVVKQLRAMIVGNSGREIGMRLGFMSLVTCFFISQAICVEAFGPTGHRVVAKIAEAHLSPRTKAVIHEILGTQSLIQISTWADEIRSDPRWRHAGPWHYVSIEDGGSYRPGPMKSLGNPKDIVQAIAHFRSVLKDLAQPKAKRAEALKWVVHLVADIHQPLHVGRSKDKGGNSIKATWFGEKTNVHAIWDEGLIESTKLSYTELSAFINHATEEEKTSWRQSTVMDWAKESMSHRDQVYSVPRSDRSGSYVYAFKNLPLVKTRLNQAGIRLAAMLNAILDDGAEASMAPALHWQRNSAEYRGLARQSYAMASKRLARLQSDKTLKKLDHWCVVLDADETIFDNSTYFKERRGRPITLGSFTAWCNRREAGAVPGAIDFLNLVHQLGGKIAVVSDRPVAVQAATETNLKKIGAPFDFVLLRKKSETKDARWQSLRAGNANQDPLKIVMFVGDNIKDFPGLSQAEAKGSSTALDEFGKRFILIPNPIYGSWEKNKAR